MIIDMLDACKFFLTKESMNHAKLQGLCYYTASWILASKNDKLQLKTKDCHFISMGNYEGVWQTRVKDKYRNWGFFDIPKEKCIPETINGVSLGFLNKIYDAYGDYASNEIKDRIAFSPAYTRSRSSLLNNRLVDSWYSHSHMNPEWMVEDIRDAIEDSKKEDSEEKIFKITK